MTITKQEADKKYANLWDTMTRDFIEKLDAPTFNEFQSNVALWAGPHSSLATSSVAPAIWNELHEPTIEEASTKGHYRDRFTGEFRTKADYEAQGKQ